MASDKAKAMGAIGIALLSAGLGVLGTRLFTNEPDLKAVIRYGRELAVAPATKETGYFDITITNEGSNTAKGVTLDVPEATRAWISGAAGQVDRWLDAVNTRFNLGDMKQGDTMNLFMRVPVADENTADRIKFRQDEGKAKKIVQKWGGIEDTSPFFVFLPMALTMLVALITAWTVFQSERASRRAYKEQRAELESQRLRWQAEIRRMERGGDEPQKFSKGG